MSLELTSEIWEALSSYIAPTDRSDAADTLVELLINTDHSAEDIRNVFRSDRLVKRSLESYLKDHDEDDEEDYDDEDDDEDY